MDASVLKEYQALKTKLARAEKRRETEGLLEQPLAYMIQDSYRCEVERDGTEVFWNDKCRIRIPKFNVEWKERPVVEENAPDLTAEEYKRFEELKQQLRQLIQ